MQLAGGYAQFTYAFNYWGPTGVNRDTFVVVTKNFSMNHQKMGAFPVSDQGQVTEWFTRVADDVIDYKFEVKDPVYYTQTWTGQIPLRRSKEHLFEYACHEGNYGLPNTLRGVREEERLRSSKP